MLYKDWIKDLRNKWNGKKVIYKGRVYTVKNIDYNGFLLIDKKSKFTDTTAVSYTNVTEM